MIDFIKVSLPKSCHIRLWKLDFLDFRRVVSEKTGLSESKSVAEYKGLKIILHDSGYSELRGSLHKFKNNGKHNYDDFFYSELQVVLDEIEGRFSLDLSQCILRNIEIGVNIIPSTKSTNIIDGALLHRCAPFKWVKTNTNGKYLQSEHQQYIIKLYNKSLQYGLAHELIRFEVKFRKMNIPLKFGVESLGGLRNNNWLKGALNELIKAWEETLFFDRTLNRKLMPQHIKNIKYYEWTSYQFWMGLSKSQRNKQSALMKKYVVLYSENIQTNMSKCIRQKWNELSQKKGDLLTGKSQNKLINIGYQLTNNYSKFILPKGGRITHSSIELMSNPY